MNFSCSLSWIFSLFLSYLMGSIPTAYLMGRWSKGVDIRQHGSKNVGATNAMRVLGKPLGILTLLIDIVKGLLPVLVIAPFFASSCKNISNLQLVCGIAAIFGHNWTCFLKFKGGKGVATTAGVFLGLAPYVLLSLVLLWAGVAFLTKYVSVASIIASMALPLFLLLFHKPLAWVLSGVALSWISIWKHRGNIKRLLDGTENKIGRKQSSDSETQSTVGN